MWSIIKTEVDDLFFCFNIPGIRWIDPLDPPWGLNKVSHKKAQVTYIRYKAQEGKALYLVPCTLNLLPSSFIFAVYE